MAKRIFDIFFSVTGLALLLPLLFLLYFLIWLNLGFPVLYRQTRAGLNGRSFDLIKFRTMTDKRDSNGELLRDSDRLTSFGRWLRAASLDELPELWNILRGEMSFVGPRPLHTHYLPLYSNLQARRHEVRPGLTGWAQINGRNLISWDERFKLDVWYVDNQGFLLDLKIIFLTAWKVLSRQGISGEGEATMSEFTGVTSDIPSA